MLAPPPSPSTMNKIWQANIQAQTGASKICLGMLGSTIIDYPGGYVQFHSLLVYQGWWPRIKLSFKWLSSKCKHLALWLPWVTKTELLLTISILYQAEKWWELRKMLIRGWLVDLIQNSSNSHQKNCLADNKNYQWDLGGKGLNVTSYCN